MASFGTAVRTGAFSKSLTVALGTAFMIAVAASPASGYTDGPYSDVYYVNSCATESSVNSAPTFSGTTFGLGMQTNEDCAALYAGLQIAAPEGANNGASGNWSTITPSPAIAIVGINASGLADCNLHSDGFTASYYYGDNGVNYGVPSITVDCHGASGNGPAGNFNGFIQPSRYLGFQASCTRSNCNSTGANRLVFGASGIRLAVWEPQGPSLLADGANNLYYQSGWVRGSFQANLSASDPSGVCAMTTAVNGATINSYNDPSRDTSQWLQCPGSQIGANVDTTAYPNGAGALTLSYSATNAAGATSTASKAIDVDNVTPSVSLSGPSDAPTTAGTQYVTATASAGPSGVAAIYCSLDGGAVQTYAASSARVPVAGLGSHQVACYARNGALNSAGVAAISATATFDLSIRQPTASAITFARIADALRCRRSVQTVTLPGRLHAVHRHGKRVLVRGHPRHVRRRVRRCRARTVMRTVSVIQTRHGKPVLRRGKPVYVRRRRRVVVLPHTVDQSALRVGHGKSTTVSGFVELADGTPLAGQQVQVLSTPADNAPRFTTMASVATNAQGEWAARVPAGPSRLIEAVYPGSATTEPTVTSPVSLSVPARITLSIAPHTLPWHAAIRIRGRLIGGYVPADGVALRLLVRYPGSRQQTPLLALRTDRHGRFDFTWSYHAGRGVATYPFALATTATESDYPWAAASSPALRVTFGLPTPNLHHRRPPPRRHHHKRHQGRHHR